MRHENLVENLVHKTRMKHEDLEEILCVDSRKNRPCDLTDRLPYDTLAKSTRPRRFTRSL